MSKEVTLSGSSAAIEGTLRGYMVTVRDGSGRTVGEEYFPVVFGHQSIDSAIDAAYAAAAAYADGVNCN